MLEQIISKFCNASKFINDLEGLTKYLDNLNFDERNKVLVEVFAYNSKMYSLILEENKKLEKIIDRINITKERKEIPTIEKEKIENNKRTDILKTDVNAYVTRIKKCEKLEQLKDIISNDSSTNTIIILKLVEEIFDIKKMLYQDRHSIDKETKLYFNNEIEKLQIKVEYLKQITNKNIKKEEEKKQEDENQMIFLKTNYGNVCAYSDLKEIPVDYYDLFYILLESIRSGNFKNLKVLAGDGPLVGLSEVKLNNTRIVFDCIGKNYYVILAIFIKKVDSDAAYRAYLMNRKDLYESNKKMIINAINNLDYLEENRRISDKVYSLLKKEKIKKRGVISE